MRVPAIAALLFTLVLLPACAGLQAENQIIRDNVQAAAESDDPAAFLNLTRADAEEALRSATVHNDLAAKQCWQSVVNVLDRTDQEGFFTDGSKGVLSKFQRARNVRRILTGDGYEEVRVGCAALIADVQGQIGKVVGLVGRLGIGL